MAAVHVVTASHSGYGMIEYRIQEIIPEKDLPSLNERVLRLPEWRRRNTLSFKNPIDMLQSAMAYKLLAGLLRDIFKIEEHHFFIEYNSDGKPSVAGRKDIYISLSHCRKGVMAAVADMPVGCDIEEIHRPYKEEDAMAADFCYSNAERKLISTASDPSVEFIRIWTVKEALFKLDNTLVIENIDTTLPSGAMICSSITQDYIATIASMQ